jgi:hypothetical protein
MCGAFFAISKCSLEKRVDNSTSNFKESKIQMYMGFEKQTMKP